MWFTKKSVEFAAGLLGVQNTEENGIIKNFTEIIKRFLNCIAFAAVEVGNAASILGGDRDKPDSGRDRRRTRAENRQRQRQRTRQASKAARQRYQRRFGGDAARRRFQGQVRTKPVFVKRLGFKVPKSALNMFKGVSKAARESGFLSSVR